MIVAGPGIFGDASPKCGPHDDVEECVDEEEHSGEDEHHRSLLKSLVPECAKLAALERDDFVPIGSRRCIVGKI